MKTAGTYIQPGRASHSSRRIQLDGIRAIGILIIIMGHLHTFGLHVEEQWGNYIFFVLTGFVLAAPWEDGSEKKFLSPVYIAGFYFRRIWRIMPMFIAATLFAKIIQPELSITDHLLFINPQGSSWYLQDVMLFYLIWPAIALIIYMFKRVLRCGNGVIAFLVAVTVLTNMHFLILRFNMIASDALHVANVDLILWGTCFGYLAKTDLFKKIWANKLTGIAADITAVIATVCIFLSPVTRVGNNSDFFRCTITSALLIFCTYIGHEGSLWQNMMALRPFTLIGKSSLGLMLLHLPLHSIIPYWTDSGLLHFILVVVCSLTLTVLFDQSVNLIYDAGQNIWNNCRMQRKKQNCIASAAVFLAVAVFISAAYLVAHFRVYTPGRQLGMTIANASGRYFANGLSDNLSMAYNDGVLEGNSLSVRLNLGKVKSNMVFELVGQLSEAVPDIYVNHERTDVLFYTSNYLIADIPVEKQSGSLLNIDCIFPEDESRDVRIKYAYINLSDPYKLGESLTFTYPTYTANSFFTAGLLSGEETGTWATNQATVRFLLPQDALGKNLVLHLEWSHVDTKAQTLIVKCKGEPLFSYSFPSTGDVNIPIPKEFNTEDILFLTFEFPDACPNSFCFTEMSLRAIESTEVYSPGAMLSFRKDMECANRYFLYGLEPAEEDATWASSTACAVLPLPEDMVGEDLYLQMHWAAVDSQAQRMVLQCNGQKLLDHSYLQEEGLSILIPGRANSRGLLTLKFEFPDACPHSFAFSEMAVSTPSRYIIGTPLSFLKGIESANQYAVWGLGPAEDTATWAKESAFFQIPLSSEVIGKPLILHLSWAASDKQEQYMTVRICGCELFSEDLPSEGTISVSIPPELTTHDILGIELSFPNACPSSLALTEMYLTEVGE